MKRALSLLSVLVALVLVLTGCPGPAAETYPAVTKADVNNAGTAYSKALLSVDYSSIPPAAIAMTSSSSGTINYHSPDGIITIYGTVTGINTLSLSVHETATVTTFYDVTTGYTVSGTMTVDLTMTSSSPGVLSQMSFTEVADLNFSGTGPVKKLTINMTGTIPYTSGSMGTPTWTGNISCNGQVFSPSDLGSGF